MNKKIFTLLAVACMLFTTAYNVNARSVSEKSVGALVTSLPEGLARGMYHIRIDSICLWDGANWKFYPATWDGNTTSTDPYVAFNRTGPTRFSVATTNRDTLVLAVTEQGEARIISAKDLRDRLGLPLGKEEANLTDLQAAMWCIEVEDPAVHEYGNWPTFHFTNKVFKLDLDFMKTGSTYVSGRNKGWMFSQAHENGQLSSKHPLFRHDDAKRNYRVLTAQLNATLGSRPHDDGRVMTTEVPIAQFVADTVPGMLKVSIVKISPFVLTASDFNTQLGNIKPDDKLFQLNFDPEPIIDGPFQHYLKASQSIYGPAADLGYLNVQAFSDENGTKSEGFIANKNKGDADQYNNDFSTQYLNLFTRSAASANDVTGDFNTSYRFVYFPSEDSLVINAYHVKHNGHSTFANTSYTDLHPRTTPDNRYRLDGAGRPYYYGLYNDSIHIYQIVRLQDINNLNGKTSLITIGEHPANVRMYFGINSCKEILIDYWQPSPGVYTIWDRQGRALGIRMYNGTYTPQWIELEEDWECPDRIPSYQWVIEIAQDGYSKTRINITNREFGSFSAYSPTYANEIVRMLNVLVKKGYSQIFAPQSQFIYNPLVPSIGLGSYEPITQGWVKGQYLTPLIENGDITKDAPTLCGTGEGFDYSGFRPVINAYLKQETLGYKHFIVGKDPLEPNFGKSEDIGDKKGMDYNGFTFNALNYLDPYDQTYIHLGERYDETLLQVETTQAKRTGFQFMLGQELRYDMNREETFGYRGGVTSDHDIQDGDKLIYKQVGAPQLIRYYYELKIADFYQFRDNMSSQYVVLKGAETDHSSIKNNMIYGLANVYALKEPFKFANVYLRETYFLKKDKREGEERNIADPTRRIYYAVLDRIELKQIGLINEIAPFEVSDTLYGGDGSSPYSLVAWDYDYNTRWIKARGKVASAINVATFALDNYNFPLYRRLRSMEHDGAKPAGDGMDPELGAKLGTNLDAPKTLRIWTDRSNEADFLYEDGMSKFSEGRFDNGGKQINFLGLNNRFQYPEKEANDGTVKFNYHLFIDTAFINRGTGPIKPQYLIAVEPQVITQKEIDDYGLCDQIYQIPLQPYIYARYLVNATDSARKPGSNGASKAPERTDARGDQFIWDSDWDRLAFVPAIHVHDRLYIVSEVDKRLREKGINPRVYWSQDANDGQFYVNGEVLYAMTLPRTSSSQPEYYGALYGTERLYDKSDMLGTYYDFGAWDNHHNDVTFSLRFTHSDVENPNAEGKDRSSNYEKRFYIESETNDRSPYGNPKIAPRQGGWIQIQNGVPVLSRTSYYDAIQNAEIFNIAEPYITNWQGGYATQNEKAEANVEVIAGDGFVTISNADGKQVKIVNLLGQSLVNKLLAGNNEKIAVPVGIAVVTVEGEKTVKVIIR